MLLRSEDKIYCFGKYTGFWKMTIKCSNFSFLPEKVFSNTILSFLML